MLYTSAVLLVLILFLSVVRDVFHRRTSRLPPGPPGLPFLGNLLELPAEFLHLKLDKWSKQYGPFYTIWMMGQPFLVLGSVSVAADVLDRMSAVTSDRPPMIKAREFYFHDMVLTLQDPTLRWRAQRKAIHANLNIRSTARFYRTQAHDAAYLALGLVQHREIPYHEHIHRFAGSIIFCSVYGGDVIPLIGPDPSKYAEELTVRGMQAVMPQHSVVDMLPILKPIIKRIRWLRKPADDFYQEMIQEATRLYYAATPADRWDSTTIVHNININEEKYDLPRSDAVWATMTLFMAGQETTHTMLRVFALAMLHHPEVVHAAQAQLDAVCGVRPPSFDDRENLPYIDALVKETLRWKTAIPLSVPHRVSEDFMYQGYVVPKGTIILDNLWGQTRDLSVYSDPGSFDPTRFLDSFGALRPVTPETRLDQLGFGHGRRVCPGRDFAINSMFIACAYMLWAFKFEWPVDGHGKQIICGVDDFDDKRVVVTPKPFGVVLKPRQDGLEERLLAALKE